MPVTYQLSVSAQQQLVDIYRYTMQRWGEAKADQYLADFYSLFSAVSAGEEPGRLIQAEYGVTGHYARCGKHIVYWKTLKSGEIGIAEILHERMNLGDHLAGSAVLNEPGDR